MSNIVNAVFGAMKKARTRALWQYDYGMVLRMRGAPLPVAYTVHFANQPMSGTAKTRVGGPGGVEIPDEYLLTGAPVYAWVYLHTGEADGETVYMVEIPVNKRPKPTEEPPTPVQQGLIEQAIAALDAGVDRAEDAAQRAEDAADRAEHAGGGGEPTGNYNNLYNKPRIEGVELEGNKRFEDLGLTGISEQDIDDIIFGVI